MPSSARRVPDYSTLPPLDLPSLKARATAAWRDARKAAVLPVPILDRLHSEMLLAIDGTPEHAASVMCYRSEVLYRLLLDRTRWLDERDADDPRKIGEALGAMAQDAAGRAGC
jgi:hypothetical protein